MSTPTTVAAATQVYQLYIKTTPEQLWQAITDEEFTVRYFHGSRGEVAREPGGRYTGWSTDRTEVWVEGEVLEIEPPRRLVHTWRALYDPACAAEPPSRVTWDIEPQEGGGLCLLTVVHDRLEDSPKTRDGVSGTGWMWVLSGLKSVLETGEPLG